jgi:hypothetical protein
VAAERLKLGMTVQDMVRVMSGGHRGATIVCMRLLQHGERVDPDTFHGGVASILDLDTLGIYEARIWTFYKDVCDRHLGRMIAVLRAHALGQLAGVSAQTLNHAVDNRGQRLDLDAVIGAVKSRLPNFQLDVR